jgi:hypothetical protein
MSQFLQGTPITHSTWSSPSTHMASSPRQQSWCCLWWQETFLHGWHCQLQAIKHTMYIKCWTSESDIRISTVKPCLEWSRLGQEKVVFEWNVDGLLIEVEIYGIVTFGTGPSGLWIQAVTRRGFTLKPCLRESSNPRWSRPNSYWSGLGQPGLEPGLIAFTQKLIRVPIQVRITCKHGFRLHMYDKCGSFYITVDAE